MPSSDQIILCLVEGTRGAEIFPDEGEGKRIFGKETDERMTSWLE